MDQSLGGLVPLEVEIKLPTTPESLQETSSPWTNEQALSALDRLENTIRNQRGVGSVMSLPDIFKASGLRSGKKPVAASEIMFLLSMSNENPLDHFLSSDGKSARISIRLKDIPGYRMWYLVQEIRRTAQATFPAAKIRTAGTAAYVHDINNALAKDLLYGFWQAMLVIGLLLIISYRSILWAILACIPNLAPPALLLGILSLTKVSIKPGIAIVLSISLGLAFNNTVYLLERLRTLLAAGVSRQKSLTRTFWSEGNPCFFSSMVLVLGFGSFAVSYFKMNQLFGIFMILSVLTGMVGDLIMLPALLKFLFEKFPSLATSGSLWGSLKIKPAKALWVFAVLVGVTFYSARQAQAQAPMPAPAPLDLENLAKKMESLVKTKDETGRIAMDVIDADGSVKKRDLSFSRMEGSGAHYTLIRLESPKDMKGTALLSVISIEKNAPSAEQKWVYLPSSKQTRKISTSEGNARVLDSELYTQDLELASLRSSQSKLVAGAGPGYTVETEIKDEKSPYSKTVAQVDGEGLLQKVDAFDKKGKLLKRIEFANYEKVSDKIFRASTIRIENLQNKRKTHLQFTGMKVNQNLQEKSFTPNSLSDSF